MQKNTENGKKPFVIGLCGGIGSGKSAAAQILQRKGAYIIDTDKISKEVTKNGTECDGRLREAFPQCVSGGALQKSLLKTLVFSDENARDLLNSIIHPYILSATLNEINEAGIVSALIVTEEAKSETVSETFEKVENPAATGSRLVVVQVPLLFESGFDRLCDVTACVIAPHSVRLKRVTERDEITEQLAMSIMARQMTDEQLKERCDFVIDNGGSVSQLEQNVAEFFRKIQGFLA